MAWAVFGSRFDLLPSLEQFNHHTKCAAGVLEAECASLLREFSIGAVMEVTLPPEPP